MKDITLSIPKPCHEKWEDFLPTAQGGFCSACNKEVIDFTSWTDEQIKNYFLNLSTPGCGKFKSYQLKTYPAQRVVQRRDNYWFVLSAFAVSSLFAIQSVQAKTQKASATTEVHPFQIKLSRLTNDTTKMISGVVRYKEDGATLPGVAVKLKHAARETYTDADGHFTLEVSEKEKADTLVFSFIGMSTVKCAVRDSTEFNVMLEPDVTALNEQIIVGGICARRFSVRGLWWRIKNIFH